jgi:hypothetical protein
LFLWPEINELAPDLLAGRSLIDVVRAHDDWYDDEVRLLDTMPAGMQESIRALLHQNLGREQRMEVQFAWLPGHAWKLTVSEDSPGDGGHPGAITVLLESPHPGELLSQAE